MVSTSGKSEHFTTLYFAGVYWNIRQRYDLKKRIGVGTHGVVVSAADSQSNISAVAIKRVDVFRNTTRKHEARQILREVRLMRCMRHPNIISLLDVMLSPTRGGSELNCFVQVPPLPSELYMVTELMSTDLHHILSAAQCPGSAFCLKLEQTQYMLYQLVCGVQYLGSAGVLHRDLKPSNLLVDLQSCQLRICDFGLARALPVNPKQLREVRSFKEKNQTDVVESHDTMTEYVVTRCYRAPELLLGDSHYGPGIDMWSIGCILAEMLAPCMGILFQGDERRKTLTQIASILGRPSDAELWFVSNVDASTFMKSLPLSSPDALKRHILSYCSPPQSAVCHPAHQRTYPFLTCRWTFFMAC